jgi:hypothetical protein
VPLKSAVEPAAGVHELSALFLSPDFATASIRLGSHPSIHIQWETNRIAIHDFAVMLCVLVER